MELKWSYDPVAKLATAYVNESIKYTTPDGGQTVYKYVDGTLVKTMHKYGADNKFMTSHREGKHIDNVVDEWGSEVEYLIKNHSKELGEYVDGRLTGYRNKNGDLEAIGQHRGQGVNNAEDKIGVNRLFAAANVTEWWDWEVIAESKKLTEEGLEIQWKKNTKTNEIVRVSAGTPPFPCCVYPQIHGPYSVVDLEKDLSEYDGFFVHKPN